MYLAKEDLDIVKYSKLYREYVVQNIDEIVELIAEAEGIKNIGTETKKMIARRILQKWDNEEINSSEFNVSLIIAMNRIGVM